MAGEVPPDVSDAAVSRSASPDVTDDAFLGGRVRIQQPRKGYRAGLDAVLLAAACPLLDGEAGAIIDAGAGVGTVGLCIARRIARACVVLVEREAELAALARANVARNDLAMRVTVVTADLALGGALAHESATASPLAPGRFDHAVANPPFYAAGSGTRGDGTKAAAHQMHPGDLDRWVAFLATVLRTDGSLTMIHEAAALPTVLATLDGRFGALDVLPVAPRAGDPALRILVQGRKGSRRPLRLLAPLILHGEGHSFRPEIDAILRHGAPLAIG